MEIISVILQRYLWPLTGFFCFVAITALAAPALDVAAIDHDRILKAAADALKLEPVTITKFSAKLNDGGTNDFYSNGDYWWPDPTKTNGLPYIRRDGELLRVFFLDPKTRMNPTLQFAQAIPGVSLGRGIGIIDTLQLIEVPLAIEAIQKSPELPPKELADLKNGSPITSLG